MMQDILNRTFQKMSQDLQDGLQECLSRVAKDLAGPSQLLELLKGFDLGAFGDIGHQPGFDPYMVLGLEKSAADDEVKHRYRDLMRKLHPDAAGEGTGFLAAVVNLAFQQIKKERGL